MTDRYTLMALAERVEKATGPDRELDALIAEIAGWSDVWYRNVMAEGWAPGGVCKAGVLHYTASLDAAMSLVPEGWRWHTLTQPRSDEAVQAGLVCPFQHATGHAATPALALTAAALRAIGEKGNG